MTKGDEFIGGGWWRREATGEKEEGKKEKMVAVGTTLARKFIVGCEDELHASFEFYYYYLWESKISYILFRVE